MLLLLIMLLSLPVVVPVLKKIVPLVVNVSDPEIVQFWIVLLVASAIKRIVLVPAVAEAVVFEIIRAFPLVLSPSIVTLSAPFKSIRGLPAVMAPEIVRVAPPDG